LVTIDIQVLSAILSTPEWEKWDSTLAKLSRAIVSSEMIISEKAEKVLIVVNILCLFQNSPTNLKTPNRSALKAPNPAAAEKLPLSIIPLETKTL
jgi:hypothetical protein